MRKINPDHTNALIDLMNLSPYYQLLSMKLCEVGMGYSRVEVTLQNDHLNPFGIVHGGAYSSMLDTAAYWSAYCQLDEGVGLTTIDLNVNFLSMAREGKIIIEATPIKIGKSLCLTEAHAKDAKGRLLASCTSKLMILHGKQSIETALDIAGYGALPPKFL